jgi:hypothetical protein
MLFLIRECGAPIIDVINKLSCPSQSKEGAWIKREKNYDVSGVRTILKLNELSHDSQGHNSVTPCIVIRSYYSEIFRNDSS